MAHTQSALDEIGDALRRPQIARPAMGVGSLSEQFEQCVPLAVGEFGLGPRMGFGIEAARSVLVERRLPTMHGTGTGLGASCDLGHGEALGQQTFSPPPSAFEFVGRSWWSHAPHGAQANEESYPKFPLAAQRSVIRANRRLSASKKSASPPEFVLFSATEHVL